MKLSDIKPGTLLKIYRKDIVTERRFISQFITYDWNYFSVLLISPDNRSGSRGSGKYTLD